MTTHRRFLDPARIDLMLVIEVAFRAYARGHLSRVELARVVEQCINIATIENGYADEHGLPFPEHAEEEV